MIKIRKSFYSCLSKVSGLHLSICIFVLEKTHCVYERSLHIKERKKYKERISTIIYRQNFVLKYNQSTSGKLLNYKTKI